MKLFRKIDEMNLYLDAQKDIGCTIGFVPTMGALHQGHVSLIRESKQKSDITVCSIFVNPTQFNVQEDFLKYPKTIDEDILVLSDASCDVLFLPTLEEMYPSKDLSDRHSQKIDFGFLNETLEGQMRPGHFDGVAQIVEKLLVAVTPDHLYMGQKDFQQVLIIRRLIKARDMSVDLVICPIIREKDGLAMSSRNVRLTGAHRKDALNLSKVLFKIRDELPNRSIESLLEEGRQYLRGFSSIKLEYLEVVDADVLRAIRSYQPGRQNILICVAAHLGDVRLIDNVYVPK